MKLGKWIDKSSLASIPEWLLSLLVTPNLKKVQLNPEGHGGIPEGARNSTLTSIGGFLHAKGILPNKLEIILQSVSETSCCPPLPTHEIRSIIQSLQNYEKDDPWQTPEELPEQTAIAESLSSKDLPHCLRPWLTDLADRMQIPLEFVAAPALISVATLVGRKIGIRPLQHDDWTVVPNLWGFLVAEPGAMKSPAIAAAMKPLEMIEKEERQKFEKICIANQEDHRRRRGEIESLRQALKVDLRSDFLDAMEDKQLRLDELEETDSKYKEIPEKRYKTNDPTVEKLALILKDNPQGVLLLRDELNGWLDSLTRSGREGSKEFYLETWNGQGSFSVDRIGRGSVHVDALCLSVFGGIQPTKLEAYIERNSSVSGDDGFLERFQVVFFPEKRSEFKLIDRNPNEEAFHLAFSSLEFIDSIKTNVSEGSYLRYTKAAQEQVDIWRVGLELRILNERLSPIFRSHIGKFRSLMPSLSLLFALLDQAPHKNLPTHVGEEPTRLALRWCQIFESHILKIYKNSVHDPYFSAKALAQKIKSLEVCDGDTIREITRKKWKALNSSELLQAAIQELTDKKWIRVQKIRGQGGPSEVIRINPSIQVRSKKGGSHV